MDDILLLLTRHSQFRSDVLTRSNTCAVTGDNYSIEAAHIVPHVMGTTLLTHIVRSFQLIRANVNVAINSGVEVESNFVFGDVRVDFAFSPDTSSVNHETNGQALRADVQDGGDREALWAYNPWSEVRTVNFYWIHVDPFWFIGPPLA